MSWLLWAQLDPVGQTVLLRFSLPVPFFFHLCVLQQLSPAFLAPGISFMEDSFSMDGEGDGFGMVQVHYIHCALYYYYYISSALGYQTLDPRCWGPLFYRTTLVFSPAVFLMSWGRRHLAASGFVSLTEHIYQRTLSGPAGVPYPPLHQSPRPGQNRFSHNCMFTSEHEGTGHHKGHSSPALTGKGQVSSKK